MYFRFYQVTRPDGAAAGLILPWREAGPPNHHDDKVDSDQQVVNKELSLCCRADRPRGSHLRESLLRRAP